jgi:Sulfatase
MQYLALHTKDRGQSDLTYCYENIKNNSLLLFLQQHNYQFYNYSIFDFEGQPGRRLEKFLPVKTRLITAQTFLSRAENSIFFNVVTRLKSKAAIKKLTYAYKYNNENIYQLTWDIAAKKNTRPKFVYAHLELPHYPYYYDMNGAEQPLEKLTEGNQSNKTAYIEYLQYGNKKLTELIDHILQTSPSPPIIVLMGDHGFRHFSPPVEEKYYFMNLCAVHLPSGNYSVFNDSLTGVNMFRALLNTQYGQRLPFLKDSTSYLRD